MSDSLAKSRRDFVKLIGSGTVMAGVAGCVGSDDDDTGDDDDDTTTEANGEAGDAEPNRDNVFNIAMREVENIDPARTTLFTGTAVMTNMYDSLLYTNEEILPSEHLATGWEVDEEGTQWTFDIREGVIFHSGNEMTAEDVRYSLVRNLEMGTGWAGTWQGVIEPDDVSAPDDNTLQIDLEDPFGPLLESMVLLYAVDKEVVEENIVDDDYGRDFLDNNSAGTGAYVLEEWLPDQEIILDAHDDHWRGWTEDRYGRVEMPRVREESTIIQLVNQRGVDMVGATMSPSSYNQMAEAPHTKTPEDIYGEPVTDIVLDFICMHTQRAPTDDENVRKAIFWSFDFEEHRDYIQEGGTIARGPVPPAMAGHNDEIEAPTQDLEKAQEYLDQSDYTVEELNDFEMEIIFNGDWEKQRQQAMLLQDGLLELGIEIHLNGVTVPILMDTITDPDEANHFTVIQAQGHYPSVDTFIHPKFHPDTFYTWMTPAFYSDPDLTELIETARAEPDRESREELYNEAQMHLWENKPEIWMGNMPYMLVMDESVGGWEFRGSTAFIFDIWTWYNEDL